MVELSIILIVAVVGFVILHEIDSVNTKYIEKAKDDCI